MISTPPQPRTTGTREAPVQVAVVDVNPRCWQCSRLLAEMTGRPWRIRCSRCGELNDSRERRS